MKLNADSPPAEEGELFDIHVLWLFSLAELPGSPSQQGSGLFGGYMLLFCKQGGGMRKLLAQM